MWEFWRGKLASSKGRTSPAGGATASGSPRSSDAQRRAAAVVNFKDLNLSVDDELSEDPTHPDAGYHEDEDPTNKTAIIRTRSLRSGAQKNKLVIIMVGLPGRGKTFLCNKLKCYLNWLGHNTAHFNVGNYRRSQKEVNEVQDAQFFDAHNKHGVEARCRALLAAIDDVTAFIAGSGQVAIFDATNTTRERRQLLINTFHGRVQYMFIESICNDSQVLEDNYRYKMKYSPDYQGVDTEAALSDFKRRIVKYNEVYEPIDDRRLHYIKLIDMVTGRGYMDVNRISGYIPGKIVFFLMQVCKAGMHAGQSRKIWLTRHGESLFNQAGRIGGDAPLSGRGEEYARLLPDVLEARLPASFTEAGVPVSVWTSTLRRTIATAHCLPYPKLRWKALDEIHAGVCDGMTYPEVASKFPEDYDARKRDKLRYRYPSGESYLDVIQRLEPVIIEMEREREYVCVVGHQAVLRAIFGYFMAVPLDTIPRLDMPLHTLIELQPRPDGTMEVAFIPVPVSGGPSGGGSGHHGHHAKPSAGPTPSLPVPLGSSPQGGAGSSGGRGLRPLVSHSSLPTGFLTARGSPKALRTRDASGAGAAAAGAAGAAGSSPLARFHRRTASGTALAGQFGQAAQLAGHSGSAPPPAGGMQQCGSFATVSSMSSLSSTASSGGGGGGGFLGFAGFRSRSATALNPGGGSAGGASAGSLSNPGSSSGAAAAGAGAGAGDEAHAPEQEASDAGLHPWSEGPSPCSSSGGAQQHAAMASAAATAAAGAGGGLGAALELQGLELSDSVALTSAAGDDDRSSPQGGGLSSASSASSSGSGAPVLSLPVGPMDSVD